MRGLTLVVCSCLVAVSTAQFDSLNAEEFAGRVRLFSGNMYSTLMAANQDNSNNLIYSPLSIYETLGMILAGSQENTTKELLRGMDLPSQEENFFIEVEAHGLLSDLRYQIEQDRRTGQSLLVANAMFVQESFSLKPTYTETLNDKYGAYVDSLNFNDPASIETVNNWIEENTGGRIENFLSSLPPLTQVLLANAVYFNASWKHSFLEAQPFPFTLANETVVVRDMMIADNTFLVHQDPDSGMEFLAIPYASLVNDTTSYFVVGLPEDGDFSRFDERAGETLENLNIRLWRRENRLLQLPKFDISTDLDVKPILQTMGVSDMFSARKSNLAGVSNTQLYVSEFLHKASITVNEEGTEASAATIAILVARTSSFSDPFRCDRPFFYGIYNEHAKIFTFLGKINDPNPEQ